MTLAVMGVVALIRDFRHPYRSIYDHQAREFARRFWPEQAESAELACLQWDFGITQRGGAVTRTAIYLCNQHIYSPNRRQGVGPRFALVTPDRPLRCVTFDDVHLRSSRTNSWLESMKRKVHSPSTTRHSRLDDPPRYEAWHMTTSMYSISSPSLSGRPHRSPSNLGPADPCSDADFCLVNDELTSAPLDVRSPYLWMTNRSCTLNLTVHQLKLRSARWISSTIGNPCGQAASAAASSA